MSRLQREVRKKQPFASLAQEATLNLARTNDRIGIRFERLFREHGLTPSQYNILRILRGEGKPLPILDIASRTVTVVPGITGLIDRLEKAGFVCRRRCTEDRRVIFVEILAKGLQTLNHLDQPVLDLHEEVLGGLTVQDLKELIRLLEKVRERLEE
ncbi:MAG TPA: MarR family transcriptional regulator [Gemmataceae bacterium]|nr:MarR family transcriptional regulator [Gemmataceae bacterium]